MCIRDRPDTLLQHILKEIAFPHDLSGKKVLVTAGPTREALDPVRYLSNHSSGKMGYAIAKSAMLRGADVTLVSGPTSIEKPPFVNVIDVVSAEDMFNAVKSDYSDCDYIFKAAAVADYTPETFSDNKIKKKDSDLSIPVKRKMCIRDRICFFQLLQVAVNRFIVQCTVLRFKVIRNGFCRKGVAHIVECVFDHSFQLINLSHLIALDNIRENSGVIDIPHYGIDLILRILLQVSCRKTAQAHIVGKLRLRLSHFGIRCV